MPILLKVNLKEENTTDPKLCDFRVFLVSWNPWWKISFFYIIFLHYFYFLYFLRQVKRREREKEEEEKKRKKGEKKKKEEGFQVLNWVVSPEQPVVG